MIRRRLAGSFLALFLTLLPARALGCAVCFGDQNSSLVQGANAGILFLLAIVVAVLATFAGFFAYLMWRARNPLPESEEDYYGLESNG
jgi:hypothetical protein